MQFPFENMPSEARVWVYQASRNLNITELAKTEEVLAAFTDEWNSHGHGLSSSFKVFYNRFLVLAVDETAYGASGCSIDKSVNLMKELEQTLGVSLLDKTQIAYLQNNEIASIDFRNVKTAIAEGNFNADTIIFNNLVDSIDKLNSSWKQAAGDSWLARHFQTKTV
jgi:hypothetical protein